MLGENRQPDLGTRFGDTRGQVAGALERLEGLREPLTSDMSIEVLEQFEDVWKRALADLLTAPITGSDARRVAVFQRDVGLLPKYKSYAIKASSPLGYSVFFQEPGKGFSFQQHRHHKVEIFHVLDARPDSFALICSLDEWSSVYEREAFSRWLEGASNPAYDRWRIPLAPGDVIRLESTGVVHSVIGCVLRGVRDRFHGHGGPAARSKRGSADTGILLPGKGAQPSSRHSVPFHKPGSRRVKPDAAATAAPAIQWRRDRHAWQSTGASSVANPVGERKAEPTSEIRRGRARSFRLSWQYLPAAGHRGGAHP